MEYLDGLSLAELVERHGVLPPARVVYLLRQVCAACASNAAGLITATSSRRTSSRHVAVRRGRGQAARLRPGLVCRVRRGPFERRGIGLRDSSGRPGATGRSSASPGAVAYYLLTGHRRPEGDIGIRDGAHARDQEAARGSPMSSRTRRGQQCAWPRTRPSDSQMPRRPSVALAAGDCVGELGPGPRHAQWWQGRSTLAPGLDGPPAGKPGDPSLNAGPAIRGSLAPPAIHAASR